MSRTTMAATAANLPALKRAGFRPPRGLQAELDAAFAARHPFDGPAGELARRLALTQGGDAENDAQSSALRRLAAQLTPTQVWDVLRQTAAGEHGFLPTSVWACVRDGLLPHDARIVGLFGPDDSPELREDALEHALRASAQSLCDRLCRQHTDGEITTAELAECGHDGCTPITRDLVFEVTATLGKPLRWRLAMLFDQTSWSGGIQHGPKASSEPGKDVSDALLDQMHAALTAELAALGPFTASWVELVRWLTNDDHRLHRALTPAQVEHLLGERPGLVSDLLVCWLGPRGVWHMERVVLEHGLAFLPRPWGVSVEDWKQWLTDLMLAGHPGTRFVSTETIEEYVIGAGLLQAVPWPLRRAAVLKRTDWLLAWLRNPADLAHPGEVRELINDGDLGPYQAFGAYAGASPEVRVELLNTPGLPALLAEKAGERRLDDRDAAAVATVLTGVVELMPRGEKLRARLLTRVLSATSDGTGPLDGPARLCPGLQVLTDRWSDRERRLHSR